MRERLLFTLIVLAAPAVQVRMSAAETNPPPPFAVDALVGADRLSEQQKSLLARNGFVILPEDYRQVFEVYYKEPSPFYVTADSVIHAFSVVLEDCIQKREKALAGDLIENLRKRHGAIETLFTNLAANAHQNEPDVKAAKESLLFLAGVNSTAGRLLDSEFPVNPAVREAVETELKLVIAAEETTTSPLTGRPRDYRRFKPVGQYAGDPVSTRLYRAVRSLQDNRFHVESEKETLAGLLLSLYPSMTSDESLNCKLNEFYGDMFGGPDDLSPLKYWSACNDAVPREMDDAYRKKPDPAVLSRMAKAAQANLRKLPSPRINDEALSPANVEGWQTNSKSLRLISPAYLPESDLMARSTWPTLPNRVFPSGLDVGILLGSQHAFDLLTATESKAVAECVVNAAKDVARDDSSLYPCFLRMLGNYRAEMDRNSRLQPVFRNAAWEDKTLNSLLCGWSLIRHSACLAGKEDVMYFGEVMSYFAGYVEPAPQFYLALAELLLHFEAILCASETPIRARAAEIVFFSDELKTSGAKDIDSFVAQRPEYANLGKAIQSGPFHFFDVDSSKYDINDCADVARRVLSGNPNSAGQNARLVKELGAKRKRVNPNLAWLLETESDEDIIRETLIGEDTSFPEYHALVRVCLRLASIALKEVENVPLDEADKDFIKNYGEQLGFICFYDEASMDHPHDTMPVVVSVFSELQSRKNLLCGIGRAKCMKIVIRDPQTGKDMVCSGGITLYHEMLSGARMSDEEWRAALLKPDGPKPAPWIARYMAPVETRKAPK